MMLNHPQQNEYDFIVTDISFMTERKQTPNWKIDKLINPAYYIIAYSILGEATYIFNEESHVIKQGDFLFFPKNLIRSAQSNPENPWSFYSVAFDISFGNAYSRERFNSMHHVIGCSHLYKLPTLFSELIHTWTGKRTGYLIKCRSILLEILYIITMEVDSSIHPTSHYQAIERILNMIHTNYTHPYSIDDLAKLSGLSSSHFRLLFKRITGLTAVQYQNSIKIHKAKDLLLSGDCNVSEAASLVGFNDIYYFSRLFKKITNTNPSSYL